MPAVTAPPKRPFDDPQAPRSFVVQKHAASRLHYDFRLEIEGVLVSWAIPKGPSLDPADKRLAMRVDDHELAYGSFEGTIAPPHYGAGTVIIWDRGTWHPLDDARRALQQGKLPFELRGEKLEGRWELVKIKRANDRREPWLLLKKRDEFARDRSGYDVLEALPQSVLSGR